MPRSSTPRRSAERINRLHPPLDQGGELPGIGSVGDDRRIGAQRDSHPGPNGPGEARFREGRRAPPCGFQFILQKPSRIGFSVVPAGRDVASLRLGSAGNIDLRGAMRVPYAAMKLFLSAVVLAAVSGCATIMQGTKQQVAISSTPTGASVRVDTASFGTTPVTVELRRKDKHIIQITMDGYQPFELTTSRSTSGWVWGNIVFGGIIGLVVDASTGGMYKLKPEEVQATLANGVAEVTRDKDVLYIGIVLEAQPGWERIGGMTKDKPFNR
jgi:hypothetical protein